MRCLWTSQWDPSWFVYISKSLKITCFVCAKSFMYICLVCIMIQTGGLTAVRAWPSSKPNSTVGSPVGPTEAGIWAILKKKTLRISDSKMAENVGENNAGREVPERSWKLEMSHFFQGQLKSQSCIRCETMRMKSSKPPSERSHIDKCSQNFICSVSFIVHQRESGTNVAQSVW